MPTIRAQVVLPGLSGVPEDVFVNTLHFSSASVDALAYDAIAAHLEEFYNDGGAGPTGNAVGGIAAYLSNVISRVADAVLIKMYDVATAPPRIATERRFTLAPPLGDGTTLELPAEVACCGSFYALQNRPRQRGRVYIGPFTALGLSDATFQRSRPNVGLTESIWNALNRLIAKPANTQNLAVYSTVDGIARVATAGWVDDAWDTQRRRGQDPAGRITFPL